MPLERLTLKKGFDRHTCSFDGKNHLLNSSGQEVEKFEIISSIVIPVSMYIENDKGKEIRANELAQEKAPETANAYVLFKPEEVSVDVLGIGSPRTNVRTALYLKI